MEGVKTEEPNEAIIQAVLQKFKINPKKPYFFFLGTIEPRKNLIALIAAYKILIRKILMRPCLFSPEEKAGKTMIFLEAIKKLNLEEKIKYIGYVSNMEKFALMKSALIFVYPSLYEGFGLPILEAMSLNTPVITSRISSLPEVAGDGALMIDPNDDNEIASALEKLWKDDNLRAELIAKGKTRAEQFSWSKTAEQTVKIYRTARI